VDFLLLLAPQIALALVNARLYKQLEDRRVEEGASLLRLSRGLLTSLDSGTLLDEALRIVAGPALAEPVALRLIGVAENESFLFLRYGVCASASERAS